MQVEEEVINDICRDLKNVIKDDPDSVQSMLLKCAVQISTKVPLYSLLVGAFLLVCSHVVLMAKGDGVLFLV